MRYEKPLFSTPIYEYQQRSQAAITQVIERVPEDEIKAADDDFIEKLIAPYRFQPLVIEWDSSIALTDRREQKEYVRNYANEEREVIRPIYSFEVSYSGSRELLYIRPSTSKVWKFEPRVSDRTLHFEISDRGSEQANKQALQQIKENLEHDVSHLNNELGAFNSDITSHARVMVQRRKERIENAIQGMGGFGVPVRGLNLEPEEL